MAGGKKKIRRPQTPDPQLLAAGGLPIRQPRRSRDSHPRKSALQQPSHTVIIGHGSPPFQASTSMRCASSLGTCQAVAVLSRSQPADSTPQFASLSNLGPGNEPLPARRRASTPAGAPAGTRHPAARSASAADTPPLRGVSIIRFHASGNQTNSAPHIAFAGAIASARSITRPVKKKPSTPGTHCPESASGQILHIG